MPPSLDDVTTCVRRFGRATRGPGESRGYEHVTGARMATTNGHEVSKRSLAAAVILKVPRCSCVSFVERSAQYTADDPRTAYSSDAVYLYSTHDDPSDEALGKDTLIPSIRTSSTRSTRSSPGQSVANDPTIIHSTDTEMEEDIERMMTEDADEVDGSTDDHMDEDADEGDSDDDSESTSQTDDAPVVETSTVPIVYPRARFSGACNVETVKDGALCAPVLALATPYFFVYSQFPWPPRRVCCFRV